MTLNNVPGLKNSKQNHTASFLKDVLDSTASGIIVTDNEDTIQYANPVFLKIFKYDKPEEIIGQNAACLFVSDRIKQFADAKCIVKPIDGQTREAVIEYKDGTESSVEVSFSEVKDKQGRVIGKMATFIDVSKRKKAKKKLRESEEKLRMLSRKIIESQENERKRVAKELHDSVGGNLAAIKLALEQKLTSMDKGPRDDIYSLEEIVGNIKDTILEVRRISNHMMPAVLEEMGLVKTIHWFCRQQGKFHQNSRFITQLEIEEESIHELLKVTIFRIIQEAVNNAIKHSGADTIQLSLSEVDDCIKLCVTDNGCGFDPENISSNPDPMSGFGLKGMNDRAMVCDGTFEIDSEIGKGTKIKFSLPNR